MAVQSAQAALDGFHCRLFLGYQEPDLNTEDTDSTSVFHKYIRKVSGEIPYNYYNESTAGTSCELVLTHVTTLVIFAMYIIYRNLKTTVTITAAFVTSIRAFSQSATSTDELR